jgi:hypothetical protein
MGTKLQALRDKLNSLLSTFWAKLNTDVSELWNDSKFFVITFGVIIAVIKFREIIINFIIGNAKSIFNNAQNSSNADQNQENQDNSAAQQLINEANQLPNDEPPVSDDWFKK